MEKQPWLNILGKPACSHVKNPVLQLNLLLLTPPKTIQIALRLLAGQIEGISKAQRSHTQKHTNVTKARAQ